MVYGNSVPSLSGSVSGFVGSETLLALPAERLLSIRLLIILRMSVLMRLMEQDWLQIMVIISLYKMVQMQRHFRLRLVL